MPKWVLRTLILLIALLLLLLLYYWLWPGTKAYCCLEPGIVCQQVSEYQECASAGGKLFHADQTTCDKLCVLVPTE
jgi:hypothetical protein